MAASRAMQMADAMLLLPCCWCIVTTSEEICITLKLPGPALVQDVARSLAQRLLAGTADWTNGFVLCACVMMLVTP